MRVETESLRNIGRTLRLSAADCEKAEHNLGQALRLLEGQNVRRETEQVRYLSLQTQQIERQIRGLYGDLDRITVIYERTEFDVIRMVSSINNGYYLTGKGRTMVLYAGGRFYGSFIRRPYMVTRVAGAGYILVRMPFVRGIYRFGRGGVRPGPIGVPFMPIAPYRPVRYRPVRYRPAPYRPMRYRPVPSRPVRRVIAAPRPVRYRPMPYRPVRYRIVSARPMPPRVVPVRPAPPRPVPPRSVPLGTVPPHAVQPRIVPLRPAPRPVPPRSVPLGTVPPRPAPVPRYTYGRVAPAPRVKPHVSMLTQSDPLSGDDWLAKAAVSDLANG